jgi:azurin
MTKIRILLQAAAAFVLINLTGAAAAPAKDVELTAGDNMRFNLAAITAEPGQTVHVTLTNMGTLPKDVMGHNWILLAMDQDPEAYAKAALGAKADNYEPKSLASQVLAVIPLLGPRKSGEVTFTAPMKPGKYPYLCSFPAHFAAGMRGVLTVQ